MNMTQPGHCRVPMRSLPFCQNESVEGLPLWHPHDRRTYDDPAIIDRFALGTALMWGLATRSPES